MADRRADRTALRGGGVTEPHFTWGAILLAAVFPGVLVVLAIVLHVVSGRRGGRL